MRRRFSGSWAASIHPRCLSAARARLTFIGGTPISWAGPLSNWVAACDVMLGMDVDHVVPGHGPVTDKAGVGLSKRNCTSASIMRFSVVHYGVGLPVIRDTRHSLFINCIPFAMPEAGVDPLQTYQTAPGAARTHAMVEVLPLRAAAP